MAMETAQIGKRAWSYATEAALEQFTKIAARLQLRGRTYLS